MTYINGIWETDNPSNFITIPKTTQTQLQQTSMIPQGTGSIWSGNRRLDYNSGEITRNYVNTPIVPVEPVQYYNNIGTTVTDNGYRYNPARTKASRNAYKEYVNTVSSPEYDRKVQEYVQAQLAQAQQRKPVFNSAGGYDPYTGRYY